MYREFCDVKYLRLLQSFHCIAGPSRVGDELSVGCWLKCLATKDAFNCSLEEPHAFDCE